MADGAARVLVPTELDALDAALGAVLHVVAEHADEWDARTRQEVVARVQRQAGRLTAVSLAVVAAERRAGTWALSGDRDLPALLGRLSRQGRGAGFPMAEQAAAFEAMPAVAQALVDGPVTPRHLQEIARATGASPMLGEVLGTPEGQADVVRLAGRLDAAEFARALAQRAAALDPAARQRAHDEQRASRYLHLAHTPGGTLLKGRLDSVAGQRVQRAIDALCPRPALDDTRDRGQRQADALTAMATAVLSDPTTTPGSTVPAQVTLLVAEQTWAALRSPSHEPARAAGTARAPRPGRGSTRDVVARLRSVTAVLDEDGAALPATEVAKALCDCQITRMVMDAPSVPIDEGRGERLFTARQRRAVIARDGGGCSAPGCTLPARYTQLHHITWWSRGGATDLDRAVQVCDGHHGYVHDHDVRIHRNRDGRYAFVFPDGRPMAGSPPPDADDPPGAEPCPSPPGAVEPLREEPLSFADADDQPGAEPCPSLPGAVEPLREEPLSFADVDDPPGAEPCPPRVEPLSFADADDPPGAEPCPRADGHSPEQGELPLLRAG